MAARTKQPAAPESAPEKRVITGSAGFALLRLAKKSGVYELYRNLAQKAREGSEQDYKVMGLEIMFGISERIVDCEKEFWDVAAILLEKSVDEVKEIEFSEVLSVVVPELMEPGMMSFFTKTPAASGK